MPSRNETEDTDEIKQAVQTISSPQSVRKAGDISDNNNKVKSNNTLPTTFFLCS